MKKIFNIVIARREATKQSHFFKTYKMGLPRCPNKFGLLAMTNVKYVLAFSLMFIFTGCCSPASAQTAPALDKAAVEAIVREVLAKNPEIITDALAKKELAREQEKNNGLKAAIDAELKDFSAGAVVGNPKGDVTIVEYMDYNCYYCHKGFDDLRAILLEDKNIRVVIKDLPIIKKESLPAAKVAMVLRNDPKFFEYHTKLFQQQGIIDANVALRVAKELGIGGADLKEKSETPEIQKLIEKNYTSAALLGIQGTPAFIIGDVPMFGAVGVAKMKMHIANYRKCGKASGC